MINKKIVIISKKTINHCKLYRTFLDKMLEECSSSEIDLLIYFSQVQTSDGILGKLISKNICSRLNMKYTTYLTSINSLINKGFISLNGKHARVIGNSTINDNYKESYLNTNKEIFFSKDFFKLSLNEKRLTLKILIDYHVNNQPKFSLSRLKKILKSRTYDAVNSIINNLKKWFNITISKGTYDSIISFERTFKDSSYTQEEIFLYNHIEDWCAINKIDCPCVSIKEIADLFKQYGKSSFEYLITQIKDVARKYGTLRDKNKLISKLVSLYYKSNFINLKQNKVDESPFRNHYIKTSYRISWFNEGCCSRNYTSEEFKEIENKLLGWS